MSATSNPKLTVNVQLRHHRFSVDAYDEMVARGILTSGDRVELLAGEIVEMAPIGSRHAACVRRLSELFTLALAGQATVSAQSPIALPPDSEPEPDIAILRRRSDSYAQAHPRAGDVLLLIEVSDSTISVDRAVKVPLYARAGIAEVWIVDLTSNVIEVYVNPHRGTYIENRIVQSDAILMPLALPDLKLRVHDVLLPDG